MRLIIWRLLSTLPVPMRWRPFVGEEEAEGRDRMSPTDVAHLSQNVLLPLMLDDARQAALRWCPSSQVIVMQGDDITLVCALFVSRSQVIYKTALD